jgi:hypothetical protein
MFWYPKYGRRNSFGLAVVGFCGFAFSAWTSTYRAVSGTVLMLLAISPLRISNPA